MTPERWQQIREVFGSAIERAPGERAAFVKQVCAGDEDLRREVESLLASYERDGSFLEEPAFRVTDEIESAEGEMLSAGQSIGHYEVISLLGEGGMGEVYLARDERLGRRVALKLLPARFTTDRERLRRFEREAHAASVLNHPNVCTIHEVGETDEGRHYIVIEYVEGVTLREHIAGGRLSVNEVLDISTQIAAALSAAHDEGIIHRDIKPENVIIRRDGLVKVLDFGLAKLTEHQQGVDLEAATRAQVTTHTGLVMGTPRYMSPEQARGIAIDARTDIWSLGCVLYEMVTRRVPFEGETNSDVIVSILEREPPPLVKHAPDVPAELHRIITKALRKDREERYQSTKDLALDLRSLEEELEFSAKLDRSSRRDASAPVIQERSSEKRQTGTAEVAGPESNDLVSAGARESPQKSFTSVSPVSAESSGTITPGKRGFALTLSVLAIIVLAFALYMFAVRRGPVAQFRTLAVLPFKPLSANDRDESLELGMADTLIARLSSVREIVVKPVTAVRKYGGLDQDAVAAGRELAVEAVLDGSLQRAGERVRVSVRLLSVADGRQLWAGKFDEAFTDIFAVQDAISERVAASLALRLSGNERERLTKRDTENTEAYQEYVRGRYHWNKRTGEGFHQAIKHFQRAIEIDAAYALAYAGLADCYNLLGGYFLLPPKESYPLGKAAATRALEIDESLPEAHAALAFVKARYEWDWAGAETEFRRAIDLNQGYAVARSWYALYNLMAAAGRVEEAIREARRAEQLDPASIAISVNVGWVFYNSRQYDQAIAQSRKTLEMDRSFPPAYATLGLSFVQKGMYAEAIAACEEGLRHRPDYSYLLGILGFAHAVSGREGEAQKVIDRMNEEAARRYIPPTLWAQVYTGLRERDRAFEWLERGYEERDARLPFLNCDPAWDSLRSDPRFANLLQRIGLAK